MRPTFVLIHFTHNAINGSHIDRHFGGHLDRHLDRHFGGHLGRYFGGYFGSQLEILCKPPKTEDA